MPKRNRNSRAGRDNGGDKNKNSRAAWWSRGHYVTNEDDHRGDNEGLSAREIRALEEENDRPWGSRSFSQRAIANRGRAARRGIHL